MFNAINLEPLYDFLSKIVIFSQRSSVQAQVVAIFVVFFLVWVLSKGSQRLVSPSQQVQASRSINRFFTTLIRYSSFPLYGLVATALASQLILTNEGVVGLLTKVNVLFGALLLYRLFLGLLYTFFSQASIRRYHNRFFAPLFLLYMLSEVFDIFTNLQPISNIVITTIFDSAIKLGSLVQSIIGLYLWIAMLWMIQDGLLSLIGKSGNVEKGNLEVSITIVRYFMIAIGVVIFLTSLGFNAATIAAVSGGLSVGIGFGLQEIIGNFFSGIFLFFEGALKPGDIIEVDGEISIVKSLSFRATTVQTFNNIEKIIPNQRFFTSSVVTYTGSDHTSRLLIPIGVSYSSDPEQVIQILHQVAQKQPKVLNNPEPMVFLQEFGDSSINFQLAVWIDDPTIRRFVMSDINRSIWKALAEHHIEIPFPQRDIHIRSHITSETIS